MWSWCDYYCPYRRLVKWPSSKSSCHRRGLAIFSFPLGMLLRSATAAWLSLFILLAASRWLYRFLNLLCSNAFFSAPSRASFVVFGRQGWIFQCDLVKCLLRCLNPGICESGCCCELHIKVIRLKQQHTLAKPWYLGQRLSVSFDLVWPFFLCSLWSTSFVYSTFVCVLLFRSCPDCSSSAARLGRS